MVFSSLTFLVFFLPLVLLLYFCIGKRHRNNLLLVFSLIFYAWGEPKWIFVMLLTVFVNYISGLMIGNSKTKRSKTLWMLAGVVLGLGFLIYFKYCGFILENVSAISGKDIPFEAPVLPIGISFYTFQVLTYTIDVYRGKVKVQKNFSKLLLYVSFFPQLIAGPIVNYKDIEAELSRRRVSVDDFYRGFMRFISGFAKKILIANTCGEVVRAIDEASSMSVAGAWIMAVAYALQIFFDFSGYSDMAIGMGRMFGFHFLENFDHPYISASVTEFWRRWHMSLGSFFREYVYIPLGGDRKGKAKQIRNIFIVWALTGIWHGASWNFMLWGVYYAVLLIIEKLFLMNIKEKLPRIVNILTTLFFVIIGWVLFYYTDMSDVMSHLRAMFGLGGAALTDAVSVYYFKQYLGFIIIGIVFCIPWGAKTDPKKLPRIIHIMRPVVLTVLFIISLGMLVGQSYNPFLYFRF